MKSFTPALIAPGFSDRFGQALAARTHMPEAVTKNLLAIGSEESGRRCFQMVGDIAVIPVCGILVDKFPWIGCPWVTGYDALRYQIAAALGDQAVKAVVLDMDSGGGMVAGCFDFVDWMYAAKQEAGKPLASILTESAYSACYAIASNTDSIAVPRTGGCGSIGVVMLHVDVSKWLAEVGITPTFIVSGEHKVDGNAFEPLSDDVKERFKAECDALRNVFAETVARGRGIDVKAVLQTEARCYDGPDQLKEALRLGLADAIVAPDQAFAVVQQAVAGA